MTRVPQDTSAEEPDGGNLQVRIRRGPGSGDRPGLLYTLFVGRCSGNATVPNSRAGPRAWMSCARSPVNGRSRSYTRRVMSSTTKRWCSERCSCAEPPWRGSRALPLAGPGAAEKRAHRPLSAVRLRPERRCALVLELRRMSADFEEVVRGDQTQQCARGPRNDRCATDIGRGHSIGERAHLFIRVSDENFACSNALAQRLRAARAFL
jgi:hypothetical protein